MSIYYRAFIQDLNIHKSPDEIVSIVLNKVGLTRGQLLEKTRATRVVYARHIISYKLRHHIKNNLITLKEVAVLTGRTNHASVLNSIKEAKALIECNDKTFKDYIF